MLTQMSLKNPTKIVASSESRFLVSDDADCLQLIEMLIERSKLMVVAHVIAVSLYFHAGIHRFQVRQLPHECKSFDFYKKKIDTFF